jgi:hypothetical protein
MLNCSARCAQSSSSYDVAHRTSRARSKPGNSRAGTAPTGTSSRAAVGNLVVKLDLSLAVSRVLALGAYGVRPSGPVAPAAAREGMQIVVLAWFRLGTIST